MYFVPLSQLDSVELLVHSLKAAGGEADCTMCPVRKVCTKQCLAVAEGIQQMVATNTLPNMDMLQVATSEEPQDGPEDPDSGGSGSHLRIVK